MSVIHGPQDITDERLRQLFDYWISKRGESGLPGRTKIDALEIPDHLSHICLIDAVREDGRTRFRYRLVGTAVVAALGQDLTGIFFDEYFEPQYLDQIQADYNLVVDSGKPHLSHRSVPIKPREFLHYDRLLLPLAADGKTVDTLLAGYAFHEGDPAAAERP